MPKDSPSIAKNKIRRSLAAIVDPHPSKSEANTLWEYFDSCCAYCGASIPRDSRSGHLDHLVPSAEGGSNDIHNHALSCGRCNGDEKREESWVAFLAKKATSDDALSARRAKIDHWLSLGEAVDRDQKFVAAKAEIVEEAIANFERSVERMRALRDGNT